MFSNKFFSAAILVTLLCCSSSKADLMIDSFVADGVDRVLSSNYVGYGFTVAGMTGTPLEVTGLGAFDLDVLGIAPGINGNTGITVTLTEVVNDNNNAGSFDELGSVVLGSGTGEAIHPFTPGDYDGGMSGGVPVPVNGFRTKSLASSVTLMAGRTYVVFADYGNIDGNTMPIDNELFIESTSFTQNSAVSFLDYNALSSLFPAVFSAPGSGGANFGLTATPALSFIPFASTESNPIGPTIVFGPGTPPMPGVPEPSSIALLGLATLFGLFYYRRRSVLA